MKEVFHAQAGCGPGSACPSAENRRGLCRNFSGGSAEQHDFHAFRPGGKREKPSAARRGRAGVSRVPGRVCVHQRHVPGGADGLRQTRRPGGAGRNVLYAKGSAVDGRAQRSFYPGNARSGENRPEGGQNEAGPGGAQGRSGNRPGQHRLHRQRAARMDRQQRRPVHLRHPGVHPHERCRHRLQRHGKPNGQRVPRGHAGL